MKGSYALLIHLKDEEDIRVGALGRIHFPKGHYLYLGSAMNGIKGRVKRHLRVEKKLHWHIDYFLKKAEVSAIYCLETSKRLECTLAKRFTDSFEVIPKFGSSDCSCKGHLFYGEREDIVNRALDCGMKELSL